MYCIYLHRNLINGKVYIGQTKFGDNPNKRWQGGEGYKRQINFYEDISKYGWDNFDHIILASNLTLERANALEIKFIEDYQSTDPQYGYNIMSGGGNTLSNNSNLLSTLYFNDEKGILRSKKVKSVLEAEKIRYNEKYQRYFGK